jgi:hypothetical protein
VTAATSVVKRSSPAAISVMDYADTAEPAMASVAATANVFRLVISIFPKVCFGCDGNTGRV